jgi:hypothetical protein
VGYIVLPALFIAGPEASHEAVNILAIGLLIVDKRNNFAVQADVALLPAYTHRDAWVTAQIPVFLGLNLSIQDNRPVIIKCEQNSR